MTYAVIERDPDTGAETERDAFPTYAEALDWIRRQDDGSDKHFPIRYTIRKKQ